MPNEDEDLEDIDRDAKANTFEGYAEAFTIFAKYSKKKFSICAEHDEIFAAHDIVGKVSKEDLKRLAQLGWTTEDGSFHRFV